MFSVLSDFLGFMRQPNGAANNAARGMPMLDDRISVSSVLSVLSTCSRGAEGFSTRAQPMTSSIQVLGQTLICFKFLTINIAFVIAHAQRRESTNLNVVNDLFGSNKGYFLLGLSR